MAGHICQTPEPCSFIVSPPWSATVLLSLNYLTAARPLPCEGRASKYLHTRRANKLQPCFNTFIENCDNFLQKTESQFRTGWPGPVRKHKSSVKMMLPFKIYWLEQIQPTKLQSPSTQHYNMIVKFCINFIFLQSTEILKNYTQKVINNWDIFVKICSKICTPVNYLK